MRQILAVAALMAVVMACGPSGQSRIVVGSKNFTEQVVLGELVAQHLEHRTGLPVDRRFYLAGSYICHQAILAGRIDIYVEYTGTALTAILKQAPTGTRSEVYDKVRDDYARKFLLDVMPPLGFNNTFAMVIRGDDSQQLHLSTLSQAAPYTPKWRLGVGYEFLERPDGYRGLAQTYGFHFAESPRVMDLGLLCITSRRTRPFLSSAAKPSSDIPRCVAPLRSWPAKYLTRKCDASTMPSMASAVT
jgi:osmoprotectant transport system substrate-binding protein